MYIEKPIMEYVGVIGSVPGYSSGTVQYRKMYFQKTSMGEQARSKRRQFVEVELFGKSVAAYIGNVCVAKDISLRS